MPRAPRRGTARRRNNRVLQGRRQNNHTPAAASRRGRRGRGGTTSSRSAAGNAGGRDSELTTASISSAIAQSTSQYSPAWPSNLPKFSSLSRVQPYSWSIGSQLATKLRSLIFALFNQTGEGQQSHANFAELYSHVQKMTALKSRPTVYEVAQECFKQWFDAFATSLTFESRSERTSPGSLVSLEPAKAIIAFYGAFFRGTLLRLSAGFNFAERQAVHSPEKKMLLSELASRCFTLSVLRRGRVKKYITELVVVFFTRLREHFNKDLLNSLRAEKTVEKSAIDKYAEYELASLETGKVVADLVKMLINLDKEHKSNFYCFVQYPLMQKTISLGQQISDAQMALIEAKGGGSSTVIHYLHWLANYLTTDQHILEHQYGFDRISAQMLAAIAAHQMGVLKMSSIIIGHSTGGFDVLLSSDGKEDRPKLATIFGLLTDLHKRTGQSAFLQGIEEYIEQHFAQLKGTISSKFNFKRRTDQVAFSEELQLLKHKWDGILLEVFPSSPTNSELVKASIGKIDRLVFLFFHSILQLGDAVPQALAFYMHNLMLKQRESCSSSSSSRSSSSGNSSTSTSGGHHTSKQSLSELNKQFLSVANLPSSAGKQPGKFFMSVSQMERYAALYHLLTLLQYTKDVSSFFDYCKHFFCVRLLMSSTSDSCIFSLTQELAYFDLFVSEIKRVFVDTKVGVPSTLYGELLHKQFTQNLGDFQAIARSWINSEKAYRRFQYDLQQKAAEQQQQKPVVSSFRIANIGTWKLALFDRCQLPDPLEAHFKRLEQLYQVQNQSRRLLLNTAAGCATISATFWRELTDAQPLLLTVSLHQLAILEQFKAPNGKSSLIYEQLLKGSCFQVENNAKLAILSLVYCGLLKVIDLDASTGGAQLRFEVDSSRRFYDANKELATGGKTKDLSIFEHVNFWSEGGHTVVDLKTTRLMAALGVAEVDIRLEAAEKAVEDVYGNCSLILHRQLSPIGEVQSSVIIHSSDNALDRQIKIEAAIVRVVKRARHFDSLPELYQATRTQLFTLSKAALPPTDELSFDEVSTIVVDLIEKKFIKRTPNGGFEYLLE